MIEFLQKHKPKEQVVHKENLHAFWQGPLSQWAPFPFKVFNSELRVIETFPTSEHYMMAQKAKVFNDKSTRAAILRCHSPKEAKQLGRSISNFNEILWSQYREKIVVMGNVLKAMQNERFCQALMDTKDKLLIEASPYDRIWGVGLDSFDPNISIPSQWRGENLLGYCLMEVRDIIKTL